MGAPQDALRAARESVWPASDHRESEVVGDLKKQLTKRIYSDSFPPTHTKEGATMVATSDCIILLVSISRPLHPISGIQTALGMAANDIET